MCIVIAKQKGLSLQKEILQYCFDNNPDGAGFCVEVEGNLSIHKGYFTFEDFYAHFLPYESEKALLHFRIRTHGNVDETNCHPFVVSENIVLAHNGIISKVLATGSDSDTIIFNHDYLQPIVANYGQEALLSSPVKKLIESFIGGSKLVLMVKGQEDFVFFNEAFGERSREGIWFSNNGWRPPIQGRVSGGESPLSLGTQGKTNHKKREVPFLQRPDGSSLSFGTEVKTKYPIHSPRGVIPTETYGEILRVYDDQTVDVDFYLEEEIWGIYPYALITDNSFIQ